MSEVTTSRRDALSPLLTARTFASPRHTSSYWEAGPAEGPLMIFLHGWPQIGLMWRAQMEAFASEGWRSCLVDVGNPARNKRKITAQTSRQHDSSPLKLL
jgi:hypothetical protein